jgi:anti-anti-sigma factor
MSLEARVEVGSEAVTLRLFGRLDAAGAERLSSLAATLPPTPGTLLVDLGGADEILSAGALALLDLKRTRVASGGDVRLRGASERIEPMLRVAGLLDRFEADGTINLSETVVARREEPNA